MIVRSAVLARPLSMVEVAAAQLVPCGGGGPAVSAGQDASPGLLARLQAVPDPRSPQGRRYRLATLLAIGVCALSTPGYDSLTAVAEWARRAGQDVLARLGAPFDPWSGRYLAPDEGTLREVFARVDPGALAAAGFARLKDLIPPAAGRLAPDGVPEREQRRAGKATHERQRPVRPPRRVAYAADGKCLRGALRPDGTQVHVLSAVRHHDALTAASREIAAKTNEIPELPRLLDQLDDTDVVGAVFTMDALHAQRSHARYIVEQRNAHYLITIKDNQPNLAAQLRALPWKDVPVVHRSGGRGHGREEQRLVQVVTVSRLLFPHARQVMRVVRKRREFGAKHWSTETVYAITDLTAEQARADELAGWLRGHWIIENSAHWIRDVVFREDQGKVRTRNAPAVLAALRDIVRTALRKAGWTNTASARRAHLNPADVLTLHGIP
jgi:predicted transposase YbfD/YdcC